MRPAWLSGIFGRTLSSRGASRLPHSRNVLHKRNRADAGPRKTFGFRDVTALSPPCFPANLRGDAWGRQRWPLFLNLIAVPSGRLFFITIIIKAWCSTFVIYVRTQIQSCGGFIASHQRWHVYLTSTFRHHPIVARMLQCRAPNLLDCRSYRQCRCGSIDCGEFFRVLTSTRIAIPTKRSLNVTPCVRDPALSPVHQSHFKHRTYQQFMADVFSFGSLFALFAANIDTPISFGLETVERSSQPTL